MELDIIKIIIWITFIYMWYKIESLVGDVKGLRYDLNSMEKELLEKWILND